MSGPAVVIGRAHVNVAGVFAGTTSVRGNPASPTGATTGYGSVSVLQGFVFDFGIRARRERPDPADLFVHVTKGAKLNRK